jgi:hypothetical protein
MDPRDLDRDPAQGRVSPPAATLASEHTAVNAGLGCRAAKVCAHTESMNKLEEPSQEEVVQALPALLRQKEMEVYAGTGCS